MIDTGTYIVWGHTYQGLNNPLSPVIGRLSVAPAKLIGVLDCWPDIDLAVFITLKDL